MSSNLEIENLNVDSLNENQATQPQKTKVSVLSDTERIAGRENDNTHNENTSVKTSADPNSGNTPSDTESSAHENSSDQRESQSVDQQRGIAEGRDREENVNLKVSETSTQSPPDMPADQRPTLESQAKQDESVAGGSDVSSSQEKIANSCDETTESSLPDVENASSANCSGMPPDLLPMSRENTSSCKENLSSSLQTNKDVATTAAELRGASAADVLPSCSGSSDQSPSIYHIKWIKFREDSVPIITQNDNGPCPLIAIMNVLLLQGRVKFPPMMEMVTSSQLMDYLGDCILEHAPKNINEDTLLNYEQNMHDAMAVFHKLQTGLDVNVKFTGVSNFEYTSECIVFDLLEIPLYHGWLVDPENMTEQAAVGNCSYNQLVEKIISQKTSSKPEDVTEALVAEEFLNRTSHQLTYHGLSELASSLKDEMLCVFFRNNHFSAVHKHANELFLLVTDQGFLTESNVVWESLSNVEGDGHFVGPTFQTSSLPIPQTGVPQGAEQIDHDYLVALSLQREQQQQAAVPEWSPPLSDHDFALKLQEEENRRGAAAAQRQQQQQQQQQQQEPGTQQQPAHQQRQQHGRSKETKEKEASSKKSDCVIL